MAVLMEPNCIKVRYSLPPFMAALHMRIVDSRGEGSPLCVTGRQLAQRHTVLLMLLVCWLGRLSTAPTER